MRIIDDRNYVSFFDTETLWIKLRDIAIILKCDVEFTMREIKNPYNDIKETFSFGKNNYFKLERTNECFCPCFYPYNELEIDKEYYLKCESVHFKFSFKRFNEEIPKPSMDKGCLFIDRLKNFVNIFNEKLKKEKKNYFC